MSFNKMMRGLRIPALTLALIFAAFLIYSSDQDREERFYTPKDITFGKYRVSSNRGELAGTHQWYRNVGPDKWTLLTDSEYGDYTYFIDSVITRPQRVFSHSFDDFSIFDLCYDDHRVTRPGLGTGPGPFPFVKRLVGTHNLNGIIVKLMSAPSNPEGEREISIGMTNRRRSLIGISDGGIYSVTDQAGERTMEKSGTYATIHQTTHQNEYALSLAIPHKEQQSLHTYRFDGGVSGGPITRYFEESNDDLGIFLGSYDISRYVFQHEDIVTEPEFDFVHISSHDEFDAIPLRKKTVKISMDTEKISKSNVRAIAISGVFRLMSEVSISLKSGNDRSGRTSKLATIYPSWLVFDRLDLVPGDTVEINLHIAGLDQAAVRTVILVPDLNRFIDAQSSDIPQTQLVKDTFKRLEVITTSNNIYPFQSQCNDKNIAH